MYVFLVIEDHLEYDCLEEVRLTRAEIPIKCNILTSQSDEKMCQHLWQQSDQFLNATSVSTRINNCPNYFSLVSTTAYLPVTCVSIILARIQYFFAGDEERNLFGFFCCGS